MERFHLPTIHSSVAFAVSFREANTHISIKFIDFNQWLLVFFCKGSWVFVYFRVDQPGGQLPHPSPESLASPPQNLVEGRKVRISRVDLKLAVIQKPKQTWLQFFKHVPCDIAAQKHENCLSLFFQIQVDFFKKKILILFPMKGTFLGVLFLCKKRPKRTTCSLAP